MRSAAAKTASRRVRFGDLATCVNDRVDNPSEAGVERYVGLEHLDSDSLRIRRWGTPSDVEATKLLFRKGDIIFGRRRAYQRKLAVADFDGICSAHAMVLRARPEAVLPEFLPFFMQSDLFMERAQAISVGSLSPTINWKALAQEEFVLPPIEGQSRMVELLNASNEARAAYSELLDHARTLEKSLCRHLLNAFPHAPQLRVGEVAKFTSGKSVRVSELPQSPSAEARIPAYGGNGISGYVPAPLPGIDGPTIVVGRVGQFCGVTHLTDGPVWVTDNALYPVRIDERVNRMFLGLCLRGADVNRGKLGEYLPLVTQKVVHEITTPLPALDQQAQWVARYREIEHAHIDARQRTDSADLLHRELVSAVLTPRGAP